MKGGAPCFFRVAAVDLSKVFASSRMLVEALADSMTKSLALAGSLAVAKVTRSSHVSQKLA